MMNIIRKIKELICCPLFVVADARDNSITFSRHLFRHIHRHAKSNEAKVYTFTISRGQAMRYAFTINPTLDQPTQLAEIQVNEKFKTIGYECLVPTVNRIFYDYGLPAGIVVKLSISIERTPQKDYYYVIERPKSSTLLCQR